LDFDGSYANEDPMSQLFRHYPKALLYRVEIGLNTYLAVFSLGFALIPSMMRAIIQCKMLVPTAGLWTPFFYILPFAAGLDEGMSSFSLSNLLYMENPYSYKKYR
jgi:hypothetical protein